MKQYNKYVLTANALKNQLLGAFDNDYFLSMYDQATGYEGNTVLQLLQHLYENYGQLTSTQLTANSDELRTEFDPTNPIKKYITQIEKCMDIAANGGTPYSQEQIPTIAFGAMYQTGLYNEKCITWEDLPAANKAWPRWKMFLT
mmetsp:Transcript_3853/g.5724  ORF Transcript_3853/g.5724 Transcript_3853/m.5724 type:complete len:144 (+) Transcript_3853:368-799(+)